MSDIRRSILWVILGFTLVLLWDKWQIHNGRAPTFFPGSGPAVTAPVSATSAQAGRGADVPAASGAASATAAKLPDSAPVVPKQTFAAQTDVLDLLFDSEGGSLVGAQLLRHSATTGLGKHDTVAPLTLLAQTGEHTYVAQSGLVGGDWPTHKTPMRLVPGSTVLADGQDQLTLRFESQPVGGVVLAKSYTLHRGQYTIDVQHEVINQSAAAVKPQLYLQLVRDGRTSESETPFYSTFTGPAVYSEAGKFQKVTFEDVDKGKLDYQKTATDGYVAMVQHYFASAWLPQAGVERENFVRKVGPLYAVGALAPVADIAPGQSQTVAARLYVGPQEEKKLEALTPGLELVKDYGMVAILAKPLYWLLEKIHGLVGNWGWAIVLLVVLIKAAFYSLNASAYRSMAKMKAINPRIMEMRERLKDNPQQMQQEMMKIYREEKVNPIGGCLPILLQIPVFIALYWVLLSSVEMRNAPWLGWITDLSSKDPWYILPALMTLTTVIQTALNPLPPDPLQAKMMWIMPLVFSVMFFSFPAGLVIYWVTNNTLTIIQQAIINHKMGVPVKFHLPKFK